VSFVVVMVLLLVVMYVLMIRPQRQRQAQQQAMIDGAGVGDDILTTGGIYGTITEADGDDMVVEFGEGLTVHMTRRAIAAVLPPEDEPSEDELDEEPEWEAQEDDSPAEASLTHEEEAVRDDGDADDPADTPR
jgi:preprotein translocase subunit YajC